MIKRIREWAIEGREYEHFLTPKTIGDRSIGVKTNRVNNIMPNRKRFWRRGSRI